MGDEPKKRAPFSLAHPTMIVNGEDISDRLTELRFTAVVGELPRVTVTVLDPSLRYEGEADVVIRSPGED